MNFKPTKLKTAASLIFGVLTNYLLAGTVRVTCIEGSYCPQPKWINFAFDPAPIFASIIIIALIYTIWSLIQK